MTSVPLSPWKITSATLPFGIWLQLRPSQLTDFLSGKLYVTTLVSGVSWSSQWDMPPCDLEMTTFVYQGKCVPGTALAKLLGLLDEEVAERPGMRVGAAGRG